MLHGGWPSLASCGCPIRASFARVGLFVTDYASPAGIPYARALGIEAPPTGPWSAFRNLQLLPPAGAVALGARQADVRASVGTNASAVRLPGNRLSRHARACTSAAERARARDAGCGAQALKQSVARRLIGDQKHFWQARYYDFNVYTAKKRIEKLRYIHRNPVKRDLVEKPEDWEWSSFRH